MSWRVLRLHAVMAFGVIEVQHVGEDHVSDFVVLFLDQRLTDVQFQKVLICLFMVLLECEHHVTAELVESVSFKIWSVAKNEKHWMVLFGWQCFPQLGIEIDLASFELVNY